MKGHEKKREVGLKIILGILIGAALVLLIAIICVKNLISGNDEELAQLRSVESKANAIYEDEGVKHTVEYYDEFIEKEETAEGKIRYLKSRIKNFDFWCEWDCSEQILTDVHTVAELANNNASITSELCVYQEIYLDTNPIAGCNYTIEGISNEE
ncbi:hypothetical protein IKG33_01525 [Candidatus Saccharibacteria bacterium]|nr:hypothetical protein [Candidatus Saccharibacteria bacterium]